MFEQYYFFILPIYVFICFLIPEINLVLFLFIGRITFEGRLGFFDYYSLNHINLFLLILHMILMIRNGKKQIDIPVNDLLVYMIFFAWACVNYLFLSIEIEYGFYKILVSVSVAFLSSIFVLLRFQYYGIKSLQKLIIAFSLIGIGMSGLGFLSLLTGFTDSGLADKRRMAVFGGGPIVFARVVGLGAIAMMVYYKKLKKYFSKYIIILLIVFILAAQLSTLSKAPLLSMLVVIAILLLRFESKIDYYKNIIILLVIIGGIIGSVILFDFSERYFLDPTQDISQGSYGTRVMHLGNSIEAFSKSPIIGIGIGNYIYFGHGWEYPHNLIFETMTELGTIGLILIVIIIFNFISSYSEFKNNLKKMSESELYVTKTLFLMAIFILINQMFSGDLMDARYVWFLMIISSLSYKAIAISEMRNG